MLPWQADDDGRVGESAFPDPGLQDFAAFTRVGRQTDMLATDDGRTVAARAYPRRLGG